jgi:hypothetical protein
VQKHSALFNAAVLSLTSFLSRQDNDEFAGHLRTYKDVRGTGIEYGNSGN